uniref:Uncharacterized protein n=1 Tax=Bionectria ochroleuca TaxID=29856 RepID=A0A8H7NNA6_BIOOC
MAALWSRRPRARRLDGAVRLTRHMVWPVFAPRLPSPHGSFGEKAQRHPQDGPYRQSPASLLAAGLGFEVSRIDRFLLGASSGPAILPPATPMTGRNVIASRGGRLQAWLRLPTNTC